MMWVSGLSVSNCFGLLPGPYRGAWHGPDVTYFARVCAEVSRIYGTLFRTYGLNEAYNEDTGDIGNGWFVDVEVTFTRLDPPEID